MKNVKLYWLFWIWIPVLLFFGVFFNKEMDIQMHDTYLVTTKFHLAVLFSIFLFFSGVGYFLFRNFGLNKKLGIIHIFLTVMGTILFVISILTQLASSPENYLNIDFYLNTTIGFAIAILLIITGFVIYLINLLLTGIKKIKL